MLAEYTYSRIEDTRPRSVCWPILDEITAGQDRVSGNRNATWDERNYMKDADKIKAATLLVHGNSDFNVMTKNAAQIWDVLKKNNVPRQFYFHQGGHSNPLPNEMANRWFTKYLWNQDNGVQNEPKSWVVREADQCPARSTTVAGAVTASTDADRRRREPVPRRQLGLGRAGHGQPGRAHDQRHQRQRADARHRGDRGRRRRRDARRAATPTRPATPTGPIRPRRTRRSSSSRVAPPAAA